MLMLPRDFSTQRFRRLLASKLARTVCIGIFLLAIIPIFLTVRTSSGSSRAAVEDIVSGFPDVLSTWTPQKGRLHLLIPATSSNSDLCKLLLSAEILGYPVPILVNWGAPENPDPYVQHLAKVEGLLNYLERLHASSEFEEDLILIVDGYDLWFQLPPDVLIRRYYALNQAANERWKETYGKVSVDQYDIKQTVVFGPDKICWPVDYSRPACWAVPATGLSKYAFGPETSQGNPDFSESRWLNSGTIMGPTKDVLDVLTATLGLIHSNHTTDSDQFYFAEIFGLQEYARLALHPELLRHMQSIRYYAELVNPDDELMRTEPELSDARTEYFIGIDYASSLFQTLAFWKQNLYWTRPADAWKPTGSGSARDQERLDAKQYSFELPNDIMQAEPPFNILQSAGPSNEPYPTWPEVELLRNAITEEIPVTIHFTGEKRFRDVWWEKIWFQSRAEALRLARVESVKAMTGTHRAIASEPIERLFWVNAEPEEAREYRMAGTGGAQADTGEWLSWAMLCKAYEEDIYRVPDGELFHPWRHKEEEEEEEEEKGKMLQAER